MSLDDDKINSKRDLSLQKSATFSSLYDGGKTIDYTPPEDCCGWTTMPVLEFLWGKEWNNMALNYIHALRPSAIRTSFGETTADAHSWRVTVFLKPKEKKSGNYIISTIEQEVEVGLIGCRFGGDLNPDCKAVLPDLKDGAISICNPRATAKCVMT